MYFRNRISGVMGACLLVLIGMLAQGSLYAQGASLAGKVTDQSTGESLPGCNILLRNLQGEVVGGTASGPEGEYEFEDISPGIYLVEASFIGYATVNQQIEIKAGEQHTLNFQLTEVSLSTDAVVVTAGRRAEKVSEAAANIQVLSLESIEISQEPTVFGTLKSVPGIDYIETGLAQQQINARGFTSPFTGNMLVLVDYRLTSLPGIGGNFGPALGTSKEDIYQVEVIVGPNSALYGANAGNGVVNIITKDPRIATGHSVTLAVGNRSMYRVGFRSSEMLGDKFGYKISGDRFHARDFESYVNVLKDSLTSVDDPARDEPDFDVDNYVLNGTLYFYPGKSTTISYTGGIALANYINQSNIGRLQVDNFRLWYHQLRVNIGNLLGLGSMFMQAYYTADDAGDTYSLEDRKALLLLGMDEATAIQRTTFVDKPKRIDLEMQHNFSVEGKHYFTWGVQYRKIKPNSEGTFLSDGPNGEKIEIDETGIYAQYENQMFPHVRLMFTGRYDNNSEFGNQFSPRVGLGVHYQGHNFRVTYNEAFGSPPIQPSFALSFVGTHPSGLEMWLRGAHAGFTLMNVATGETRTIDKLRPTETKGFEFGYKGNFANRFLLDVTVYRTTYNDFISSPIVINDPGNGWFVLDENGQPRMEITLSYINFGEVNLSGFDLAGELLLSKNVSLSAAYSHSDLDDFKDVPANISSTPEFNSPFDKVKGAFRFSNWLGSGSIAEVAFRWVDGYFFRSAQPYNTGMIESYAVVDLNAEVPVNIFSSAKTKIGLNVKNLLNNKHRELPGGPELGILANGYVTLSF